MAEGNIFSRTKNNNLVTGKGLFVNPEVLEETLKLVKGWSFRFRFRNILPFTLPIPSTQDQSATSGRGGGQKEKSWVYILFSKISFFCYFGTKAKT